MKYFGFNFVIEDTKSIIDISNIIIQCSQKHELVARYELEFCLKLCKNPTETCKSIKTPYELTFERSGSDKRGCGHILFGRLQEAFKNWLKHY